MSKIVIPKTKLIKWAFVLWLTAVMLYLIHLFVLEKMGFALNFPLWTVYLFNALSSIVLLAFIRYKIAKLDIKVSWVYLSGILVKLVLFALVFMYPLFFVQKVIMHERLSLFFPFIIFFTLETYYVTRITKSYFGD